ncbi:lysine 2,3-aminomutase [Candidatus Formimonas warabiya]|uniref:L-lysine 2,3-aminomutase n=1 Tax=Formimonas warabiya TaxID=1761012 RepID=A0A3G1KMA8_FORW1|nr:lysine 2,3-aminomutase [Candidatus Formimonas warabiya]ATW23580.1 lysine 2,3-aminomutase [Candidatus Formimonas warabiya]
MRAFKEISLWKDVSEEKWHDWHWQIANRITNLTQLKQVINLTKEEERGIHDCLKSLRMAITPYYATLMSPSDPKCPVRLQAVPTEPELVRNSDDLDDPTFEDIDSPAPHLTHRYPDRVLFLATDQCSMYCRHCTRRRLVGSQDGAYGPEELEAAFQYLQKTPQVRDVVVSGGDPLTLSTERLEQIIKRLRAIPHMEIIRIGTRAPVVMPQRITDELCDMLHQYHPIWLNTHFNNPKEITAESEQALAKLADAGIPLGNQSVLLKGVNDCPNIMKKLVQTLVKNRVRPYYLYQCDRSVGIQHFCTSVGKGIEIMESLRGHTSGLSIPTYVIEAVGGGGKCPVLPQYLISRNDRKVILRNFEGVISTYTEPEDNRSVCDCEDCQAERAKKELNGLRNFYTDRKIMMEPGELPRAKRRKNAGPVA